MENRVFTAGTLSEYKCECGETIRSMFCPNCGARRKEEKTFTCDCGYTGLSQNFCPSCGRKITNNAVPAAPAAPAEPEVKLAWKCPKCGADNQEGRCTVCGADVNPKILFSVSTYYSTNPPRYSDANVYEYSDTQLLFDVNGKRRLISADVIEPAMEIIRKYRLNEPGFKDPTGVMGGSVAVGFRDGDKFISTSLLEQGYAVTSAEGELMRLFNNA